MDEASLVSKLDKAKGRDEEIAILRSQGWPQYAVAQAIGCSSSTVSATIRKMKKAA